MCAPEHGDTLAGLWLSPQCSLQSKAGQQQGAGTGYFPEGGKDSEPLMGSSFLM